MHRRGKVFSYLPERTMLCAWEGWKMPVITTYISKLFSCSGLQLFPPIREGTGSVTVSGPNSSSSPEVGVPFFLCCPGLSFGQYYYRGQIFSWSWKRLMMTLHKLGQWPMISLVSLFSLPMKITCPQLHRRWPSGVAVAVTVITWLVNPLVINLPELS